MKYTLHVISHTHWDREWYLPFERFRLRLVDLMDKLLDLLDNDPKFKYFHLDGQSILIEDYLQIKPENEARLREYVRQGRILVGPWFQLNDEYLVSAEANVRSLLVGMKIARDFGPCMMIGYMPDQFGNISQMPQILNGFGIDNAIFGRGFNWTEHPNTEFTWEAPDGSRVLSVLMPLWYNNLETLPANPDEAIKSIDRCRVEMGPKSAVPHLLLMNGVDHLEAQYDLTTAMEAVRGLLGEDELIHTTLPAYIDAVKASLAESGAQLEVFRGELREDDDQQVLAGTLSTRIYLKQANENSQMWLERFAEPASSLAWALGAQYPSSVLTYAWKLLMENHPHDSICGCGIDPSHDDMMPRFRQVDQIGGDLTDRALESIAARVRTESPSLMVFNPLAWKRTDKVRATVDIPLGEAVRGEPAKTETAPALEIRDAGGNLVPFAVVDTTETCRLLLSTSKTPQLQWVKRFVVEFISEDVPACGYKTYQTLRAGSFPKFDGSLASGDNSICNGLVRARSDGDGVTVERLDDDGTPREVYSGLNIFEDCGDVGDEYIHKKPTPDVRITSAGAERRFSLVDCSPISATMKIEQTMLLPESASEDRLGRSERMVECPIATYVTVTHGIPRVDFRTEIGNNSKDHRLRVLFPTGLATDVSHAEGAFDVMTRPIAVPAEWKNAASARPQRTWVDVNDGNTGLCLINKGLPEFELYGDDSRTLALTLLRCTSALTSGAEALASPTPGAQCIGKHIFEYSVYPHEGTWQDAQVWRQAHQHNVPFHTIQTEAHDGDLPTETGLVQVEPAELVVTAIKKAECEDKLIVRFFNTTDDTVEGRITVCGATSAEKMNLNEESEEKLEVATDGSVKLKVGAKKIVTLGFGV